ncbi:MAG: RpiB/LacA/LacB family sugar-phosphate isomerase [Candidatus Taylorbacteria bacterium]|nr:RpiB/LacA/LacB family sugar-phosphate isomerase [Candidatus Taylorbacteria bacterium]
MKIFIGSDHAGFELKAKLILFLKGLGYEIEDKGAFTLDSKDDYPDFIAPVASEVSNNPEVNRGIVIGGSGQGEAMVADRFPHVRASEYYGGNLDIVRLSREHNDSNVLSLGARFLSEKEAKEAVKIWLKTPFSGDPRHQRRLEKLEKIDELN